MRKNISNKLLIILCLFAVYSCKTKKPLAVVRKADTVAIKPVVVTQTNFDSIRLAKISAIKQKQTDFTTFSGKASAKLNIDGKEENVTMLVHIKKGQEIWVSVTAVLGLEVGRAVITPDSIKVMNRLESSYLKKPFSYIYQYSSDQINYKTLESVLIGNAVPELLNSNATLKPDNGDIVISGTLQDLVYDLVVGSDLRVTKTSMANSGAGRSIDVLNSMFVQSGGRVIPSQISLGSTEKDHSIKIDMHYIKVEFDAPVDQPFNIPARFTPIN